MTRFRSLQNPFRRLAREKRLFAAFASACALIACIVTAVTHGPMMAAACFALATGIGLAANPLGSFGLVAGTVGRRSVYPRFFNYITGMNGIANSATGTVQLPSGYRYHDLRLFCTVAGTAAAPNTVIEWVRITVNGVLMLEATPDQLTNLAKMYKITPSTGECPIYFTEPWRPVQVATMNSWVVGPNDTCVLQVKFLNPGGGAVGLTIGANFDEGQNIGRDGKPFLRIIKRLNLSEVMPSGAKDITDIDTTYPILRILLTPSTGTIGVATNNTVWADNRKVLEATKAQNQDLLNAYNITASFFEFPILFDYPNNGSALITRNLVVNQVSSASNTTTVHVMSLVPGWM